MKRALYEKHLNRVSRSFAFCIAELDQPERSYVGLSYILCRLLDTIEDTSWEKSSEKKRSFELFNSFLLSLPSKKNLMEWQELFPENIVEGEKKLIADAEIFWQDFHRLPKEIKLGLQKPIESMSLGMEFFSKKPIKLNSLQELDRYCFFVAGVVGELLTNVFSERSKGRLSDKMSEAIHFGLFLQKINILKDQISDEEEGRFFVEDRISTEKSLGKHAVKTIEYIKNIPDHLKGYKVFCAWSFFLGLYSLPHIRKSWVEKKKYKLSKIKIFLYLDKIKKNILDNDFLSAEYEKVFQSGFILSEYVILDENKDSRKKDNRNKNSEWFSDSYKGSLSEEALTGLGLL